MRILIVEDESALANGLKFNFEQEGFEAVVAGDGEVALKAFRQAEPRFNLILLDLMLPGMSGYDICREIRLIDKQVPILVLSARTLSEDRTAGFDAGCDQYMSKPFNLDELLSRVRNLIERHPIDNSSLPAVPRELEPEPDVRQFGNAKIDFSRFELTVRDQTHDLTTMEVQLLRYFLDNDGKVLSRSQILEDVWGSDSNVMPRTIDNFVLRLRKLIEPNLSAPRHILSVRGTGYRFLAKPEA
ncbi:MAG: DNA-binding response regulator [Planctomycetota bacterium]|nr:MAG: DNA-binding response regulator [Planctomycetota bacterium]GDY08697.1 DNA-binding response regulator [Planctomycetia bacterium]